MGDMKDWLIDRFKEPSTYRGLVWLLAAFGINVAPELWMQITTIGMGLAGGIGIVTKDSDLRKGPDALVESRPPDD